MQTAEALNVIVDHFPNSMMVSTCGYLSRDLAALTKEKNCFYLLGAMGMAAPVALGMAIACPALHFVAIDGDGSLLMNLSCLPMVAAQSPNMLHVVLDNGVHESTGGQRRVTGSSFTSLAQAAGYRSAARVDSTAALERLALEPPALLHILVEPRSGKPAPRIATPPAELVANATEFLRRSESPRT